MTSEEQAHTVSVKLSELNSTQLGQVLRLVGRQRDAAVEQSQALGRQVDELRAKRAALADQIRKASADEQHLQALIKAREALEGAAALAVQGTLQTITAADIGRIDATAPGVELDVRAGEVG